MQRYPSQEEEKIVRLHHKKPSILITKFKGSFIMIIIIIVELTTACMSEVYHDAMF